MHFTTNVIYCIIITVLKVVFYKYRHQTSAVYPPPVQNFLFPIPRTPNYKQRIACFDFKKKSDSTWVFPPQITTYWKQNIFPIT